MYPGVWPCKNSRLNKEWDRENLKESTVKKIMLPLAICVGLLTGVAHQTGEFGDHYVLFLKKPWSLPVMYRDPIGERDIRDVPPAQLAQYLSYCRAHLLRRFPCTVGMQAEAERLLK